jgi:hypothetical protein
MGDAERNGGCAGELVRERDLGACAGHDPAANRKALANPVFRQVLSTLVPARVQKRAALKDALSSGAMTMSTTETADREGTLNEALRLVTEKCGERAYEGFQVVRMNFSGRLWLVATAPSGITSEFQLAETDSAESFAQRVLSALEPARA